ncbi:hypothetical protein [Hyphomicrobium sp. DY-1]|uniref:hypothetical protein n=1 Tax=Hyphomicrobium sp. DY-1 TaxID=3075650 RepID=UPI0039C2B479
MSLVISTSFPAEMPERTDGVMPFNQATFKPLYSVTKAPDRGGRQQVAELGTQLWQAQFSTPSMYFDEAMEIQTVLESLAGGLNLLKIWHPLLKYPMSYPNGFDGLVRATGGAFDGTCVISDVDDDLATLTLTHLPNDFKIRLGDMISMPYEDTQILHRIIAPATANGSGIVDIRVAPTLPVSFNPHVSPAVWATFFKPWCLATIDADSIDGPFTEGGFGSVTFSAVQTF